VEKCNLGVETPQMAPFMKRERDHLLFYYTLSSTAVLEYTSRDENKKSNGRTSKREEIVSDVING
jgi:hypothetical protein